MAYSVARLRLQKVDCCMEPLQVAGSSLKLAETKSYKIKNGSILKQYRPFGSIVMRNISWILLVGSLHASRTADNKPAFSQRPYHSLTPGAALRAQLGSE
jgi:hypothetical protein